MFLTILPLHSFVTVETINRVPELRLTSGVRGVLDLLLRPHGDLLLLLVHHQKLHEVSVSRYSKDTKNNFIKFLAIYWKKLKLLFQINNCKFYKTQKSTFNASSGVLPH